MPLSCCLPIFYGGCGAGLGAVATYQQTAGSGAEQGSVLNKPPFQAVVQAGEDGSGSTDREVVWLNDLVNILWPRINKYLQDILKERVLHAINEALPSAMRGSIKVNKMSMGSATPKFSRLRVKERSDEAIVLDLSVDIRSNLDIQIVAMKLPVGIQAFSFCGTLTVCLRPAALQPPFFGGIEIYFINPPELDMDFTGVANVADWKVVRGVIHDTLMKGIVSTLVVPARIVHDLDPTDSVGEMDLRHPEPIGVLRLLLKSGRDLRGDDYVFTGGRTSDPYVVVQLGQKKWKSSTVPRTTNPNWAHGNIVDFLVYDKEQRLLIQAFDEDTVSSDDLLGEAHDVYAHKFSASAAPLGSVLPLTMGAERTPAGELTVSTRWFSLTANVPVNGIDKAVAHGPSQMVLCARLEEGTAFPAESKGPFTVRIIVKTKDRVYSTTSQGSAKQHQHKTRLTEDMHTMVQSLDKRRSSAEEIAGITGLSVKEVQMILSSASATDVAKKECSMYPHFGQILRLLLPWTPEMRDEAHVILEVLDAKHKRVGNDIRRRVESVAREGDSGPFQLMPGKTGALLHAHLNVKWLQIPS